MRRKKKMDIGKVTDEEVWIPTSIHYEKKKESAMNSAACMTINAPAPNTEADTDAAKRNYLEHRLHGIWNEKDHKLEQKFGLMDADIPKTPQQIIDRIKAGQFIFTDDATADAENCWEWTIPWKGIRWRDPSLKEDKKGYSDAYKILRDEKNALVDQVKIHDPADALLAIQAWQAEQ